MSNPSRLRKLKRLDAGISWGLRQATKWDHSIASASAEGAELMDVCILLVGSRPSFLEGPRQAYAHAFILLVYIRPSSGSL